MELNNKSKALIGVGLFVAGGATVYFSVPTKIETKIEVREPFIKVMNEELFSEEFDSLILNDGNN